MDSIDTAPAGRIFEIQIHVKGLKATKADEITRDVLWKHTNHERWFRVTGAYQDRSVEVVRILKVFIVYQGSRLREHQLGPDVFRIWQLLKGALHDDAPGHSSVRRVLAEEANIFTFVFRQT